MFYCGKNILITHGNNTWILMGKTFSLHMVITYGLLGEISCHYTPFTVRKLLWLQMLITHGLPGEIPSHYAWWLHMVLPHYTHENSTHFTKRNTLTLHIVITHYTYTHVLTVILSVRISLTNSFNFIIVRFHLLFFL